MPIKKKEKYSWPDSTKFDINFDEPLSFETCLKLKETNILFFLRMRSFFGEDGTRFNLPGTEFRLMEKYVYHPTKDGVEDKTKEYKMKVLRPTLPELIYACRYTNPDSTFSLTYNDKKNEWIARMEEGYVGKGISPEEATAELYITLHNLSLN